MIISTTTLFRICYYLRTIMHIRSVGSRLHNKKILPRRFIFNFFDYLDIQMYIDDSIRDLIKKEEHKPGFFHLCRWSPQKTLNTDNTCESSNYGTIKRKRVFNNVTDAEIRIRYCDINDAHLYDEKLKASFCLIILIIEIE
jgi:hypothetical protein